MDASPTAILFARGLWEPQAFSLTNLQNPSPRKRLLGRTPLDRLLVANPRSKKIPAVRICRAWMLERITRMQAEQQAQLEEALG